MPTSGLGGLSFFPQLILLVGLLPRIAARRHLINEKDGRILRSSRGSGSEESLPEAH